MGKKVSFRLYLLLSPVLLNPVVLLAGNLPGKLVVSQAVAERLFLQNNLLLIAEHYNVDKAEAEIVQARLLENPVLSLEQNIYNRLNKKYFDVGAQGEAIVSIEQVINLAGQRGKAVKVAGLNKEVVSRQFEDVVRTLAGELRQRFISVFFSAKIVGRIRQGSRLVGTPVDCNGRPTGPGEYLVDGEDPARGFSVEPAQRADAVTERFG